MAFQLCTQNLNTLTQLVRNHKSFMLTSCVLNLVCFPVVVLENLLVIRALCKASSLPANVKKLFLSFAASDLAVGILVQPMFGIIFAVMLKKASTGNYNFDSLCPTILTVYTSLYAFPCCASFLNVTAIAVDRLLAISLHLRYQELVTSKRVILALFSVWITTGVAAPIMTTLLPKVHFAILVGMIMVFIGLLLTIIAYIRIYQVVRYHQNQIQSQLQMQNAQAVEQLRHKKSAYNSVFIYVVSMACYLPAFICFILFATDSLRISFKVASTASMSLVLVNSPLNPFIYCWRYREIRDVVKSTIKNIFHISENGS